MLPGCLSPRKSLKATWFQVTIIQMERGPDDCAHCTECTVLGTVYCVQWQMGRPSTTIVANGKWTACREQLFPLQPTVFSGSSGSAGVAIGKEPSHSYRCYSNAWLLSTWIPQSPIPLWWLYSVWADVGGASPWTCILIHIFTIIFIRHRHHLKMILHAQAI